MALHSTLKKTVNFKTVNHNAVNFKIGNHNTVNFKIGNHNTYNFKTVNHNTDNFKTVNLRPLYVFLKILKHIHKRYVDKC